MRDMLSGLDNEEVSLRQILYVSTRGLVVDHDEDGDIAKCGGRARRRVMRSGQHVRVALTIDTTLVLPSDAVRFVTWLDSSGLWSYQAMLRFVTCMDGSFDVILSTMVVAVAEGAVVQGPMLCWDSTSE